MRGGVDRGDDNDDRGDDGTPPDDQIYIRKMKEILEAFPMKGPPLNAVKLSEHVYIGSQRNADDTCELQRLGINFVLNCAGTRKFDLSKSPYPKGSGIDGYLMIPAEDHEHYDMMKHIPDAVNFLDKVRKRGGKALVHCNLGINRSGTICAAYLMNADRMTLLRVTQYLKTKRSVVLCNKGFRKQLVRYARVLGLLDPMSQMEQCDAMSKTTNSLQPTYRHRSRSSRREGEDNDKTGKQAGVDHSSSSRPSYERSSSFTSAYCTLPRGRSTKSNGNEDCEQDESGQQSGVYARDRSLETIRENGQAYCPANEHRRQMRSETEAAPGENTPAYFSKGSGHVSLVSWHRTASSPTSKSRAEEAEPLSTARPLRVYRRSATDTELYQRPSSKLERKEGAKTHRHSEPSGPTARDTEKSRASLNEEEERSLSQTFRSSAGERSRWKDGPDDVSTTSTRDRSRWKSTSTTTKDTTTTTTPSSPSSPSFPSLSSSRWDNERVLSPYTTSSVLDKYRSHNRAGSTTSPYRGGSTTTSYRGWTDTKSLDRYRIDDTPKFRFLDFSESYGGTLRTHSGFLSRFRSDWSWKKPSVTTSSRPYKY